MVKKSKMPVNKLPTVNSTAEVPRAYKPTQADIDRERKYKAEDALRDIERAEGHKRDKELMKDVKCLANDKIKSLSNIK